MSGRLCWLGDKNAVNWCVVCEEPICHEHSIDSYQGIVCPKCNSEELNSGLIRELKSWAIWMIVGVLLLIIVIELTGAFE